MLTNDIRHTQLLINQITTYSFSILQLLRVLCERSFMTCVFCDLFEGTAIVPECMSASGGMMDELRNGLASLPCSNMEVLGASRRVPEAGNENLRFWPFCDVRLRRFLVVCRRVRTAYAS
jgi:hypothetical protein